MLRYSTWRASHSQLTRLTCVCTAPELLRQRIRELKSYLNDPKAPFGVDILVVKTGDGAKKSNIDYCFGRLDEMIDVIIEEGASLFVSAVGSPPPHVIKKLQDAGVRLLDLQPLSPIHVSPDRRG
jgi:NAD(P)H-dependent flavin oxidoreductase YrpB (nitropropane dioxygenase family)